MRPILVCLAAVVLAVPAFAATNLAKYAGSYPSDEVGGMTFLGDPAVIAGVTKAVPDKAVRDWVLDPNSVQTPISRAGGLLRSGACEPHNCYDHNWAILIDASSGATDVCYHDAALMAEDQSRWYLNSGKSAMRAGGCSE
ncbi:MAG: hypothetical protein KDK07_05390 [Bauldia sp.]|nr:hypothetical protein [Bauldia sp.]